MAEVDPSRTSATAGGLGARVDVPMAATMIDLIAVLGLLVITPRRQTMTDPQHALTAIDIALEPDAVMMSRAFADNAALRENVPHGFALDATHHAHITLLQCFVRTADLPSIYAASRNGVGEGKIHRLEIDRVQILLRSRRPHRFGWHCGRADDGPDQATAANHRCGGALHGECGDGDRVLHHPGESPTSTRR